MIGRNLWKRIRPHNTRRKLVWLALLAVAVAYAICLPSPVFDVPYSTVLEARGGELLSAAIASDGQWRFPETERIPDKFSEAVIAFEDKRFYFHPGVDIFSLTRALVQNIAHGRIVSGGSTLSMQVIRLSRNGRERTILEKCKEMMLATRLELSYSKEQILSLYASHAPFGGNVVGLDAACWRYFGRRASQLSWGEAALLAVLPNSPSLMHPGKNRATLKRKRDALLGRLLVKGKIDSLTCSLAKDELIPEAPKPLPRHARHLLTRMKNEGQGGSRLVSTIDYDLQVRVEEWVRLHHAHLEANRVFNAAALVLDVKTGNTLAYVGNVDDGLSDHGQDVDIITAPRSTGSILKPFLFAASLDEGLMLPGTILPDIPVSMNGFSPRNFSKQYDGSVPANQALIRSLNVPAVFMLRDFRYEKFYTLLKNLGCTTLDYPADHYGLSLILGGAEATLWDITGIYASMARTLDNYFLHPGSNRYVRSDFHPPCYTRQESPTGELQATSWLSAASLYVTFSTLKELYRPEEESGWRYFSTSKTISWKTGTSFGFRDAWAVGVNADYAVGVWTGNGDGEGRPGLTGTRAAAPLLFDIFSILPGGRWFDKPASEMYPVAVCRKSGQRLSPDCEQADTVWVTRRGLETPACEYHQIIHLSADH
jgi:penicillin-binding protein 1C